MPSSISTQLKLFAPSPDEALRRSLDRAAAGIRRSRNAIERTASYLAVAQRFFVDGGHSGGVNADAVLARRAAPARPSTYGRELDEFRAVLNRIALRVSVERTDLGMEVAELDRLNVELQHRSLDLQSKRTAQ